jgi:hypothetical protein
VDCRSSEAVVSGDNDLIFELCAVELVERRYASVACSSAKTFCSSFAMNVASGEEVEEEGGI